MADTPNTTPDLHPTQPVPSILITGGTGFVGSAVVRALLTSHPETQITILDLTISPPQCALRGISHPSITYIPANILHPPSLTAAFARTKPTAVIHTAGFVPPLSERYARRMEREAHVINVVGTRNVLRAAAECGEVRAFVYTSTCCVVIDDWRYEYANIDERWPVVEGGRGSIYAESKAVAEMEVLRANGVRGGGTDTSMSMGEAEQAEKGADGTNMGPGVDGPSGNANGSNNETGTPMLTASIRPAVIYGEHDHQLIPSIISCITDKSESPFRVGPGLNLWDTVYVGNVADAHVLALENLLAGDNPSSGSSAAGQTFFIQNNTPTSFREFTLAVWRAWDGHVPRFTVAVPTWLAWGLGAVIEGWTWWTGRPATLSRGSVNDAVAVRYASGERARRVLGYQARVGMEEGIRRSCEEYRGRREREGVHPRSNTEVLVGGLKEWLG